MILGSHNSMTFAPPLHWWQHIFAPFSVCQRKTLEQQLKSGVRCFDLRVRLKNNDWIFAHGLYEVEGDVYQVLDRITEYAKKVNKRYYIRLVLETTRKDGYETDKFQKLCADCEKLSVKWIIPFEGRRKGDWATLYSFKYSTNMLRQLVSSMASDARWYERILPFAYAKRKNKDNLKELKNKPIGTIALLDFI